MDLTTPNQEDVEINLIRPSLWPIYVRKNCWSKPMSIHRSRREPSRPRSQSTSGQSRSQRSVVQYRRGIVSQNPAV